MEGLRFTAFPLLLLLVVCSYVRVMNAVKVCQQPKKPGQCRGNFNRYFYNSRGQCQHFSYGGCGGNDNRFDSMELCQIACVTREVCHQEVDPGRCSSPGRERYQFNATTGRCERFTFRHCEGSGSSSSRRSSGNVFITKKACQAVCLSKDEFCSQPPERGGCKSFIPSFFYNATSALCEPFIYGGCGGNGNRFESIDDCRHVCVVGTS